MAYTFFLRGFAPLAREHGLSIHHAFDRVTTVSGYHHHFAQEDGRVVLTLSDRHGAAASPIVLKATSEIEGDGEDEVMILAMDGRLGGFMAVPDADYTRHFDAAPAAMTEAAIRFLICTALKAHIHVISKVRDMQTGHSKRMLDAGVESLAQSVANAVLVNRAVWFGSGERAAR